MIQNKEKGRGKIRVTFQGYIHIYIYTTLSVIQNKEKVRGKIRVTFQVYIHIYIYTTLSVIQNKERRARKDKRRG